jgi:hypothetical protein
MPRGAILPCLLALLMLSGCQALPHQNKTPVQPPVQYLQDCPEPELLLIQGQLTNGNLAQGYLDMRHSLRQCNLDKAALREWSDSLSKETK